MYGYNTNRKQDRLSLLLHGFALSGGIAGAALPAMERWLGLIWQWNERARQRRALAKLDNRPLSDIGLSRADADREACKPFWRP